MESAPLTLSGWVLEGSARLGGNTVGRVARGERVGTQLKKKGMLPHHHASYLECISQCKPTEPVTMTIWQCDQIFHLYPWFPIQFRILNLSNFKSRISNRSHLLPTTSQLRLRSSMRKKSCPSSIFLFSPGYRGTYLDPQITWTQFHAAEVKFSFSFLCFFFSSLFLSSSCSPSNMTLRALSSERFLMSFLSLWRWCSKVSSAEAGGQTPRQRSKGHFR